MENQTKINIGVILMLIAGFTYLGVSPDSPEYKDPTHYCEDKQTKMYCESLSKYYKLPNGKCINHDYGNKLCRSGWEEIPKIEIPKVQYLDKKTGMKEFCTPIGCD